MPKQGSRAEVNTFVKGLVTEASPLNFPANASLDEVNFELLRDGTRKRRLGLQRLPVTPNDSYDGLVFPTTSSNQFIWQGAGGDTTKDFLVLQIGSQIVGYNLPLTDSSPAFRIDLNIYGITDVSSMSFASVNGRLIIASGNPSVVVVTYAGGNFNANTQVIRVRDVWGVADNDSPGSDDVHHSTISIAGIYNLYNQSWGIPRMAKDGMVKNAVRYYRDFLLSYPTAKEVVWSGLAYVPQASGTDPYEAVYLNLYTQRYGAGSGASKGYFIIDFLKRGASRIAEMASNYAKYSNLEVITPSAPQPAVIPQDTTNGGARVVTEFAGRIFYAGFEGTLTDGDVRSPTLNNYICFSQLVKNDADLSKCYQEGDPTSRENSDVVDTDGGFIRISGARTIVSMNNLGSSLIVFADNGVWAVSGGSDFGFSATNYKVDKLSDFGCINASSIVTDNSNLLFWGSDAIYAISPSQTGYVVDDVSRETIQTLYNKIPLVAKKNASSAFDLYNKKLRWVYSTGDPFNVNTQTYELVFDLTLKCFYLHNLNSNNDSTARVVAPVFYAGADIPLFYLFYTYANSTVFFSFCYYLNTQFRDWGVKDAKAYMLTGAMLAGDSAVNKQTPYIVTHMRPTESGADDDGVAIHQSSCLLRAQWDWSNSVNSHKWGTTQEVYGYRHPNFTGTNDGFDVTSTKRKLRGKGRAISLYFETSPDKDCQLLGWSLTINGNANA